MKSLNLLKKSSLLALAIMVVMNVATAQSRYKHVPRVKVDRKHQTAVKTQETTPVVTPVTQEVNTPTEVAVNTVTEVNVENTTVASTGSEIVVAPNKTRRANTSTDQMVVTKKGADRDSFTHKLKDNHKLLQVKDVKKTALAKWLLWMIILLILALVFTILAVVLGFVVFSPALWTVFWILAALCYLGAIVFLILGLAGIM